MITTNPMLKIPCKVADLTAGDLAMVAAAAASLVRRSPAMAKALKAIVRAERTRRATTVVGFAQPADAVEVDLLDWTAADIADGLQAAFALAGNAPGQPWSPAARGVFRAVSAAVISAAVVLIKGPPAGSPMHASTSRGDC